MGAKAKKLQNPLLSDDAPMMASTPAMAEQKSEGNGYNVPANERHLYHCVIEIRKFNAETGERMSKPRLQKFGAKTFQLVYPKLKEQGYSVEILYSPKK